MSNMPLDRAGANLDDGIRAPLISAGGLVKIAYIGGTIRKTDQMSLKKLVFRATRGKAFTHFFPLNISPEDRMRDVRDHIDKVVYIVVFVEGVHMRDRISKICAACSSDPV